MRSLAFAGLLLLFASWPGSVSAQTSGVGGLDGPVVAASANESGITTTVGQGGRAGQVTTTQVASSVLDECTFLPSLAPSEILAELGSLPLLPPEFGPDTQRWTMIICPTPVFDGSTYGFWPVGDPIPRPVVVFLGREAVARAEVRPPTPRGAPDGTTITYMTQMPTWWWLDDADWRPFTGTAALGEPSPASVTAVLTPTTSTWQVGALPAVECGQGQAWTEGLDDADPARCGTTIEQISGPDGLTQTVTVSFDVSFRCDPAPLCNQLPPFDPVVVSTTTTVRVIQVRGLLVS